MAHLIILDKSKTFGEKLADAIAVSTEAHLLIENELVSNESSINSKLDEISDFLSDYSSDLEGLIADLIALLPAEA